MAEKLAALSKELERLKSMQEVFVADNKRLETKLNDLKNRRDNLNSIYNPSNVETISEKYKEHLKDEDELRRIIHEYEMAIDYLKNRHSSLISNQSIHHTPSSKDFGSMDLEAIEKELMEEQSNLDYQRERYHKIKSLYQVLQDIKQGISDEIDNKKKTIGFGVRGLDDLINLLLYLRDLEILANKILDEFIYLEQISDEWVKTKECWEHHLGIYLKKKKDVGEMDKLVLDSNRYKPEVSVNASIIPEEKSAVNRIFDNERNIVFVIGILVILILYFV